MPLTNGISDQDALDAIRRSERRQYMEGKERAVLDVAWLLAYIDRLTLSATASGNEAARLRKIVERLASSEAFDVSRVIDANRDKELLARMNYAASSLEAK